MEHLLTKDTEGNSLFSKWDGLIPDIFCKYEDGFSTVNRIRVATVMLYVITLLVHHISLTVRHY
jgi:hypothetical protein